MLSVWCVVCASFVLSFVGVDVDLRGLWETRHIPPPPLTCTPRFAASSTVREIGTPASACWIFLKPDGLYSCEYS